MDDFNIDDYFLTDEERAQLEINMSGHFARGRHKDYAEVVTDAVVKSMSEDKELERAILTSGDPGESLYQAAVERQQAENSVESILGADATNRPARTPTKYEDDTLASVIGEDANHRP